MIERTIIVVGFLVILLLIFAISILKERVKILRIFLEYTSALYVDLYNLYDKYTHAKTQEEKTDAVLAILNLCKTQRNNHKELEKAFGVK